MKKQLFCGLLLLAAGTFSFAGDAAAFVDMGLSADGNTYIFGEYGRTDGTFCGYAEIYTVDIAKNNFVPGAVFKTAPSAATSSRSGRAVFDELSDKARWKIQKYEYAPAPADNLLYVREDEGRSDFRFKDFEGSSAGQSVFYHVTVSTSVEGSGEESRSSFFISLAKEKESGEVLSRSVVGNPQIKRKGVTGYKIDRIFTDKSGRSLVFVIEKTVADSTGTSIRYMVETIRL